MKIVVFDNQIEAALKQLKKQMLKDGLFQEMKRRAHYEKAVGQAEAQGSSGPQEEAEGSQTPAPERVGLDRRLRVGHVPGGVDRIRALAMPVPCHSSWVATLPGGVVESQLKLRRRFSSQPRG